jgi:hypothetical protein
MDANDLLDRALYVAVEEGWHVFPVVIEPDPTAPGKNLKKPIIRWSTEASVSEQAIEVMPWHRANAIGIACGPSGLCVIDEDPGIDPKGQQWLKSLPDTWSQRTPRGRHRVYRSPRSFQQPNTTSAPHVGVDIRGDGGYIVLYAAMDELPTNEAAIAPWPLTAPVRGARKAEATPTASSSLHIIGELPEPGNRNHWFARKAGQFIQMGFTRADVATLLLPLAEQLGLSERECRATFLKSAAQWEAERRATEEAQRAAATSGKTLRQLVEEPDDAEPHALPDLLPYGMTILAGAPKIGKSWLALQTAYGLATGRDVLSVIPERTGSVGYYAVEESWPQLRKRVRQLPNLPTSADIEFYLQLPNGKAGVEHLMESRHTFIVLDTGVRALGAPSEYAEIQKLYGPLQSWAKREQRVVMILWHTTKTKYDDSGKPVDKGMDAIMGSRGLVAVADAMWLLMDGGMAIEGRDIPKDTLLLQRDGDTPWLTQQGGTGLQARVVDILRRQGGIPLLLEGLCKALNEPKTTVYRTVKMLLEKDLIGRAENGGYVLKNGG